MLPNLIKRQNTSQFPKICCVFFLCYFTFITLWFSICKTQTVVYFIFKDSLVRFSLKDVAKVQFPYFYRSFKQCSF